MFAYPHSARSSENQNFANKIIQVNLFNYSGNISYEGELDTDNKLNNFLKITGI